MSHETRDALILGLAMQKRRDSLGQLDLDKATPREKDAYIEKLELQLAARVAESTGFGTHNTLER